MDKLLISVAYLRPGQLPATHDVTLSVAPGQGRIALEPDVPPTLGTISNGTLVIESETFPRFAPLTLTISGADCSFRVRQGRLIAFALHRSSEDLLRMHCTSVWTAAYRYRLAWPATTDRVEVTRLDGVNKGLDGKDWETTLAVHVLEGTVAGSGDFSRLPDNTTVRYGRVLLRRAASGDLTLQMHGARMEWGFADGVWVETRIFDSQGAVAHLQTLDLARAGIAASVAVVDTLP